MVSRLSFNADGTADFTMTFVETAHHKAEKDLGRARFGKYRNRWTDDADVAEIDRLKAGGEHWHHQPGLDSWLGVMPRYGDVSEIKWFKGPKGVFCYHMMNAWEDADGLLHFDQCLSNTNAFAFIREPSGIHLQPWEIQGALTRWTVDPTSDGGDVRETVIGPPGDFPVIPAASHGRRYATGFMLTMNPERQGPPVFGGWTEWTGWTAKATRAALTTSPAPICRTLPKSPP